MPFDGAFSPVHVLIVAVVALVVLGPDKLPEAVRAAGKAWREIQQVKAALVDQVRDLTDEVVTSDDREQSSPELVDPRVHEPYGDRSEEPPGGDS